MIELDDHLTQAYRRDVMGESVKVEAPAPSAKLMSEIEASIARIDALRLGAHLASRDFVSYQNRRALVKLRDQVRTQLESQREAQPKQLPPPGEKDAADE